MNLHGAILMICFFIQVFNLIAVPVDPIHTAQSGWQSNSKQLKSVMENDGRKVRATNFVLTREKVRKLVANIDRFQSSARKLKTKASKLHRLQRNPAQTSPTAWAKESQGEHNALATVPKPVAVDAADHLLIPLDNFPPSAIEPATTQTPSSPLPLVPSSSPSVMLLNMRVEPSPGADPEEFSKPESMGYSDVSLDIEGEYIPLPSPPTQASQLYEVIDLSLSSTAEPAMEDSGSQPFKYLPFEYDEFEDSGYNPWTAIFVFVRRLFLEN